MSQLLEEEEENTKITLFVIGRYHDLKVHCRRPISVFSIQGPCFIFHKKLNFLTLLYIGAIFSDHRVEMSENRHAKTVH